MRLVRTLFALLPVLALSACFTADKALLTDDNSVAPFASITFVERGSGDAPETLTRQGNAYVDHQKDGDRTLRFMPVRDKWYVAEMSGAGEDASVQRLYALVHVDPDNKTAETYASMGDGKDVGPGLRACEAGICIDDLAAYIAHAEAQADAGGTPDTMFDVTVQ